jgi:hypothetical protein
VNVGIKIKLEGDFVEPKTPDLALERRDLFHDFGV